MRKRLHRRIFGRIFGKSRKRALRIGLLIVNLAILGSVAAFVFAGSNSRQPITSGAAVTSGGETVVDPLDQISSADIAVHVARMANLYEATSVVNYADSANVKLAYVSSTSSIVAKPQVIATGLKSVKDLQQHKTKPGDTVSKLAAKFGITSDSIRWSNNLAGNELRTGVLLWIPPVDGIVYVVQHGDTVASIASDFSASKDAIIVFNDAEISGLKPGQRIVIPGGSKSAGEIVPLFLGSGGYDFGWCTYYAAARSGAPGGWGDAWTWHLYAPLSGWTVSTVPKIGAVAQTTAGGAGHVGYVENVRIVNGQYEIIYSDMNGLAGWNRVGKSGWVPAIGKYQRFIYR